MTDKEIMYHRFQHNHIKKHTGLLAEMLGMSRKDYEDAVKRGMEQEAQELKAPAQSPEKTNDNYWNSLKI